MANPPITRFTSLAVTTAQNSGNPNNGLYVPTLNTNQIAVIPATTKVNGGIWYNIDTDQLEAVVQNKVQPIPVGTGGGNVIGPIVSAIDNLTSFGNNTGTLIADSGIAKDNVVIAPGAATATKLLAFTGVGKNVQESALVTDNLVTNTGTGIENNIVIFDAGGGKVIKDSGVSINQVPNPAPLLRFANALGASNATVNEIGNLGHIRFINDVSSIYVDTLTSVRFFPYNTQICSVFTSEIGSLGNSTSESALLEIHSDSGALLLSRLTTAERNALQMVSGIDGTNGMILFNTDTTTFDGYDGTNWRKFALFNTNNTLTVADPLSSTNATTKAYVDAAVSGIPTATITLNGNVTGSGLVTSPITTTLNMTLDQIKAPVANLDLNSKNIINLLDPTTAQQAATKNYVDTRSITLSGAVTGTGALGTTIATTLTNITTSQITNFNSAVAAFRLDQFAAPITSLNLNSQKIISLLDPTLAQDAATKNYVDTRTITVSGAVTGSGALGTTIATTLTNITTSQITNFNSAVTAFRLDQFAAPTASVSLGSQKIINLLNPTLAQDAATKNYVDTSISGAGIAPAAAKYIIQTANATLTNAQILGSLATGLLKNTTTTGVLTIGIAGTDYYSPGNPTRILDNAINNFFIGTLAGNLTLTGTSNTGVGINSLASLTNGSNNTGVGSASLNQNTTGISNSSFGALGLALNTLGSYNSAFGVQSLYNNSGPANYNSSFGYRSLYSNNLGLENSSFGAQSLESSVNGDDNCAFGSFSANSMALGSGNSSFGRGSLQFATSGSFNSCFGLRSGSSQTTYNNCLFLGAEADASANNLTNATAIGYQASVGASNCLVLGGSGVSVGIGTSTPQAPLQFANTIANRKIVLYDSFGNDHQFTGLGVNGNIFRFQVASNATENFVFYAGTSTTTSNELMRLKGNGRLGIGTAAPDQLLTVNSANASKIGAGGWVAFSDARIKDVVGDYEHGLAEIIQIQTRKFKYNDRSGYPESEKAKINIGIIAQEIEDIFPECIVEKIQKGDISDMRMYDGTALTYALINAVKELNNEIKILKQQINN
jgi:hypothetical protein